MTNLIEETLEIMAQHSQSPSEVVWVGNSDGTRAIDWTQFAEIANIEYDDSYGGQEVASDLVVVFLDRSWLERHEYDGSEWWEYKAPPVRRSEARPFTTVKNGESWASIHEMNRPGGKYHGTDDEEDAA